MSMRCMVWSCAVTADAVVAAAALCCLQTQMAALVSKCKGAEDLEYFLLETASLVGLNTPTEAGAKVRR